MLRPTHPTLPIIHAKLEVMRRKEQLRDRNPGWTEKQTSAIAEWDYYFSRWGARFAQSIPFQLLASLGVLTLFMNAIWFEPTLAGLLSQWSDLCIYLLKLVTLGLLEWMEITVPAWAVSYLTTGIGMTGIMAKQANDLAMIKNVSALDDPMDHISFSTGCFGCGLWVLYAPLTAWLWPAFLLAPMVSMSSRSLARDWGVTRAQLAVIQLKRAGTYAGPFVIALAVWFASASLA